jgi:hypothetical protein
MKHVNASVNEIVGSPNFQIDFDNGSKDDDNKKPLNKPIIPNEVTKQNKDVEDQCP